MVRDEKLFGAIDVKDYNRLKLYEEAVGNIDKLKLIIENGMSGSLTDSKGYGLNKLYTREDLNFHSNMTVKDILMQQGRESVGFSNNIRLSKQIRTLVENKSNEIRLTNDLAYFAVNNHESFLKLCRDTLQNKTIDEENYSESFLSQLEGYYYRVDNFTNLFLSFYLTNFSKLDYINKTSKLSENFKGGTELLSIRQSSKWNLENGLLVSDNKEGYIVFSVDLESSINQTLDFLFINDEESNPFRIRIGDLNFYRDLDDKFTTFNHFEEVLQGQFLENILNHTNSLYIDSNAYKGYFAVRSNNEGLIPEEFEFKVYGIPFKQKVKIEQGGLLVD